MLVDSPGIDVNTDADAWIDRAGATTDLFVWVVSGEATVTNTEKHFFRRVASKVAKPNVLVLFNRYKTTKSKFLQQMMNGFPKVGLCCRGGGVLPPCSPCSTLAAGSRISGA